MKGINFTSEQNVTISDGKLSVVLDALGDTSKVDLWGYAWEYTTTLGSQTGDWWGDWAPNEKFTHDTGTPGDSETPGNDSSPPEKKTPGFEVVAVIAAVAIALILIRRHQ
jgi:PGF-CTERM protein